MKAAAAPTRLPAFAIQALHVVTLTAVALTARLYAALGDMPMFFSIRQAGAVDVLLFVLILSAALPGLVVGLLWVLGRFSRRVAATSFLILSGVLLVAIALSLCRQIPVLPDPARFAFGVVLGIAATVVYWRFFRLRAIVTILAPIAVISPAIYLFATPTSQLLFRRSASAAAAVRGDNAVPVVMVVFDELSCTSLVDDAGRIDAALYPNFAALAGGATWFRNASSVAAETEAALPGILTGNLPQRGHPRAGLARVSPESLHAAAREPRVLGRRALYGLLSGRTVREAGPREPGCAVEVAVDRRGGIGCDLDPAAALAVGHARR